MTPGIRTSVAVAVALLTVTAGMGFALAQSHSQSNSTAADNATEDSSWPTHRADDGRTGATGADGPAPYPTKTWEGRFDGQAVAAPAVVNGSIYLGFHTENDYYKKVGAVAAFNESSGALEWARRGLGESAGTPTVVNGTVFVATESQEPTARFEDEDGSGGFYAFDAGTGDTIWLRNDSEKWTSAPVHADGNLYAIRGPESIPLEDRMFPPTTRGNSTLVALDPATGNITWSVEADVLIGVANGTVVVRDGRGLTAYDLHTHDRLWSVDRPRHVLGYKAAVTEDSVYAVSETYLSPMRAYAFSLEDGTMRWNTTVTNSSGSFAPAVADGAVYVTTSNESANSSVRRLDAATGATEWTYTIDEATLDSAPTVANDTVLVTSQIVDGATVYAIGAENGQIEWGYTSSAPQSSLWPNTLAPSVADDALYVVRTDYENFPIVSKTYLMRLGPSATAPDPGETPWDDDDEQDTEATVSIETSATYPDGEFGDVKTFTLNASASVDQGEIESYEWDVIGDGQYNRVGRSVDVTLEKCERRTVTVRITTNSGQTATDSVVLQNDN